MVGSDGGAKPVPETRADVTTQPGLPLGDSDDVPTDEHAALGDTEEATDEHAVMEQPTDPDMSTGTGGQ